LSAIIMDDVRTKNLIKVVSSNLIRAQREEEYGKDVSLRDSFLDKAGFDSVLLAKILLQKNDFTESSRYFLSAAYSFEKSGALNQAMACYNKIINIGEGEFVDYAKVGISRLDSIKNNLDISTKEGKINALDFLIWKHYGLTTTSAQKSFLDEFNQEISSASIRSYAKILEERKRATIWGGPQGREYRIYPNIADLATREKYYGQKSLFVGSIENRITEKFNINFNNLNYNKELFILNGSIMPKMVLAVDMDAFVQNLEKFSKPPFAVKAFGELKKSTDFEENGYETTMEEELDLIDANILYDGQTEKTIYERQKIGGA
jgi:hypothetical protein